MQSPERKHGQRHPVLLQPLSGSGAGRSPQPRSLGCVSPGHSLCASQREDEIEAIISISDGLNLVSRHWASPWQPAAWA